MSSFSAAPGPLEATLKEVHSRYTKDHPRSKENHEDATRYLPGGNTRTVLHTTPFPLTIAKGDSCYLTTVDGHNLVDFLGEYTAGIYGHSHPVIKAAVQGALDCGWNYGCRSTMEQVLAKRVCERFPALDLVRFVNSGTEANMMAVATALAWTGKKKGYHGSTISGRTPKDKKSLNLPHEFVVGTYNDITGTEDMIKKLPERSLAAILVEPMLGSGGCYAASQDFLRTLRELANENDALLIFDEVMTSRLGYHGLGHKIGVLPDLMTLGKWVGGGMSFGAFGGRRDIMGMYDPRVGVLDHPGTFNNNVFSMSAGVAGCQLLSEAVLDKLNELGEQMKAMVEDVLAKAGIKGIIPTSPVCDEMHSVQHDQRPPKMFIKGVGSIMAIHFAGPEKELLQGLFYHHMLESGIYLAQRGFIALNILLTKEHVKKFVEALKQFVSERRGNLRW